jgi:hypothetical protein
MLQFLRKDVPVWVEISDFVIVASAFGQPGAPK